MKAVAFVCILSLSLCLSQPTSQADTHPVQAAPGDKVPAVAPTKHDEKVSQNATAAEAVTPSTDKPAQGTDKASQAAPKETKAADVKPEDNKTDKAPEKEVPKNESKPAETPKNDSKDKPAETKPNEESKPAEGKPPAETKTPADAKTPAETKTPADAKTPEESKTPGKDIVPVPAEEKPVTTKPAEAPKDATEKPMVMARGFDGPSFIGGMVLTLGLLAIGFMGFKYYKNQTERNYHTL